MNTPRRLTQASLSRGARQLADADPDLGGVLDRLGEPPMWGRRPGFSALVRIILEQQGVPGLGPWSVDIYYLMALRRPDVWPRGDLALALALREVKRLGAVALGRGPALVGALPGRPGPIPGSTR